MPGKPPKTGLRRLLEIAGAKKRLLIVACLLCALSAVVMLVPFYSVYRIILELTAGRGDAAALDAERIAQWAAIAFLSMLLGIFVYFAGIMCSHAAAFNIPYGLRMVMSRHLATLPMGYFTRTTSGAIKKTLEFNVEKIEIFIAHNLPDIVAGVAAPVAIFIDAVMKRRTECPSRPGRVIRFKLIIQESVRILFFVIWPCILELLCRHFRFSSISRRFLTQGDLRGHGIVWPRFSPLLSRRCFPVVLRSGPSPDGARR